MTAIETVSAFISAIESKDLDAALALMTEEAIYENVPIGVVVGHAAIRQTLESFLGGAAAVEWKVVRQATEGNVVFNERVDRFDLGDRWLELPVVGVWEVSDGRIRLWRDYFDMKMFTDQLAAT